MINKQAILINVTIIPYVLSNIDLRMPYKGKKYTQAQYVVVLQVDLLLYNYHYALILQEKKIRKCNMESRIKLN